MKIKPHKGVGEILFGANREEILSVLPSNKIEYFRRTPDSELSFYIPELGAFIYFDTVGFCEAIEFSLFNDLFLNDLKISDYSYNDLENWFTGEDENIEIDETGFLSFKYGIGAYAADKSSDKIDSIIVFKKGYYD